MVPRVGGGPTAQGGPVPPTPGASGDPQGLAVLGLKDKAKKWAWGAQRGGSN